jgi:hypothetical protein
LLMRVVFSQEKKQILEASTEERIKGLEARRGVLVSHRIPLEIKLKNLQARMKEKEGGENVRENIQDNKSK